MEDDGSGNIAERLSSVLKSIERFGVHSAIGLA